jgi:hypothetical protein
MSTEEPVRGYIDWTPKAKNAQLVEDILTVVKFYTDGGHPAPTVRDVYYDLLGQFEDTRGYKKGDAFNRRVYRLLRLMRRSRKVGFWEINDDSSDSLVLRTFDDPADFWEDVGTRVSSYHKDLTTNQPKRIKVYTEGRGAVRQFHAMAREYAIPVYSPGGWDSLDFKHDTARWAAWEYERTGRQTVILHAGDLDPDGVDLFRVFTEDVHAFVEGEISISSAAPEEIIVFKRVMLHPHQVPENKRTVFSREQLKEKNYRGQRWPLEWKAELQALTLVERLDAMRQAIEAELDHTINLRPIGTWWRPSGRRSGPTWIAYSRRSRGEVRGALKRVEAYTIAREMIGEMPPDNRRILLDFVKSHGLPSVSVRNDLEEDYLAYLMAVSMVSEVFQDWAAVAEEHRKD